MKKSLFRRILNRVLNLIARVSPGATTFRPMLHRARGVKIGRGVFIGEDVYLDGEYPEMIEIHEGAAVTLRASIVAHNKGPGRVIIEREALIGPHAVVLCNSGKTIRIGEGAVIGAGCVVTRNVAARTVLVSAPAQVAGRASVPLATAETIEEFWAGLRPLARKAGTDQSAADEPASGDTPG